jgi:hypothetical protein
VKKAFYLKLLLLITMQACQDNERKSGESKLIDVEDFYNEKDYSTVPKYDVHIHIFTRSPYFVEQSQKDNYRLISVNVDAPDGPPIREQQEIAIEQMKKFPGTFNYATTFPVDNWNSPGWENRAVAYLKNSFKQGAVLVKIWKNIGMTLKNKQQKFVMVDNPRFDTVINFIAKNKIPIIGHLGEPKNCWLPIEKMTVNGDKQYFKEHPEYHMYLHPEYPSYEDQIAARDHMLDKHPDIAFIGAHLASLEWDVDEIAKRLDKYPNMVIETAARISHLQHQAITDHKKVYDFFIKYQDRILYGSDLQTDDKSDSVKSFQTAHDTWFGHWRFFTSDSTLTDDGVNGSFKGLHLPKQVIDKLYFKNAEKWIPRLVSN